MTTKRRKFTGDYKKKAIRLVTNKGMSFGEVGEKLGIRETLLRSWKSRWDKLGEDAFPGNGKLSARDAERAKRIAENRRLRRVEGILKKSDGLLCQSFKLRFRFIKSHRKIWPVRLMCKTLEASHSGFYEWLKRPESTRSKR